MPYMPKCLLMVTITALSSLASADETQEFVKITCVASAEEFRLEYVTMDYHEAFGDPASEAEMKVKWREFSERGLFNPMKLTRECKLAGATYRISTDQREPSEYGRCGGSPTIYLSLERNRKMIFKHVAFGSLCSHEANIKSIEVPGSRNGLNTPDMKVCVSKDGDDDPVCTALDTRGKNASKSLPVDAMGLRSLSLEEGKEN